MNKNSICFLLYLIITLWARGFYDVGHFSINLVVDQSFNYSLLTDIENAKTWLQFVNHSTPLGHSTSTKQLDHELEGCYREPHSW